MVTRAPASATAPRLVLLSAAALIFILAASNGVPVRTSSSFFVLLVTPLLFSLRGGIALLGAAERKPNGGIYLALLALLCAHLASAIANPQVETMLAVLLRCVLPLMIYLALVGLSLRRRDVELLVLALAAGSSIMFLRGLLAFYAEFGFPDLETLLWARYDKVRISGYSEATLGNVTHMGLYISLVLPPLVLAVASGMVGGAVRAVTVVAIGLTVVNLVICGSRAAILVTFFSVAVIIASLGRRAVKRAALACGVLAVW